MRFAILLTILIPSIAVHAQSDASRTLSIPTALQDYVHRSDDSFQWKLEKRTRTDAGTIFELRLTSQTWQGIEWKHAVEIFEPRDVVSPDHALLFVTGGSRPSSPGEDEIASGLQLAKRCGARVVVLHQTPNQPLLGDRYEDDLITETWLRYLDTGDETWPLLFPMVKSAVRTMDAVEAFSKETFEKPIKQFVITGASKRGWTSWLTPVADKRVIATAPIVIDVLNFRAQINHQLETWGKFSEQIIDYTSKGLVKRPDETESARELALRRMMDPFTYRNQLKLPKLLIVGTNDPYWVVDAMNLYWDDLEGQKFIRQVPNVGHGLQGGKEQAMASLAEFFRHVVSGQPLPKLSWSIEDENDQMRLTMTSSVEPKVVRLWGARSNDLDFRGRKWTSTTLSSDGSKWIGEKPKGDFGHVAVFGEFEFDYQGIPWSLTTLVYRR